MINNLLLATGISLFVTGFIVYAIRPAWKAWKH